MKQAGPSVPSQSSALDRRSFLRLSSAAALAAALPPTPGVEPAEPAIRRGRSTAEPDLYGRWFAV